jgi:hypothetical protein
VPFEGQRTACLFPDPLRSRLSAEFADLSTHGVGTLLPRDPAHALTMRATDSADLYLILEKAVVRVENPLRIIHRALARRLIGCCFERRTHRYAD